MGIYDKKRVQCLDITSTATIVIINFLLQHMLYIGQCLYGRQPVTQFKILNGRQFFFPKYRKLPTKINIECSYIEKEPSSDSEAFVRSENWFVVYARHTTLVKLIGSFSQLTMLKWCFRIDLDSRSAVFTLEDKQNVWTDKSS